MEKKIEKLEGSYDVPQLKQKLNEIIDYLNTQSQPEERKSVCDKHRREICRECMHNGNWTFEDTPEKWEKKVSVLIKEGLFEEVTDDKGERVFGYVECSDKVLKEIKQLLSEREREVLETIKELVDGKSIYSNNGCGTPLELIEWFVDTELDKLSKKK